MKKHTTHHDDCGCLSARYRAEIAKWHARAESAEARVKELEAERDAVAGRLEKALVIGSENRALANKLGEALEETRGITVMPNSQRIQGVIDRAELVLIEWRASRGKGTGKV